MVKKKEENISEFSPLRDPNTGAILGAKLPELPKKEPIKVERPAEETMQTGKVKTFTSSETGELSGFTDPRTGATFLGVPPQEVKRFVEKKEAASLNCFNDAASRNFHLFFGVSVQSTVPVCAG